jgi:GAF domain-containing protein
VNQFVPAIQLNDIVITEQISTRRSRPADIASERWAFREIAHQISEGPGYVIAALCRIALKVCNAGSSGISTLHPGQEDQWFTWDALAGEYAEYVGGQAPRHHSPCGVTLARAAPQLFAHPGRYFEWMRPTNIPIAEGLVIPLYKKHGVSYGTIWIMSHNEERHFDAEDVRVMTELGTHATTALRLQGFFEDWPTVPHYGAGRRSRP